METGRYGAYLVAQAIEDLDEWDTAEEALKKIDSWIADQYGDELPPPEERIQACAVIYSRARREVWNYGDCALIINGNVYTHEKKIDQVLGGLRAFIIHEAIKLGCDTDSLYENDFGREAIMPYLKKQAIFANPDGPFGYPVIDGSGINVSMIKVYGVEKGGYGSSCK